MTIKELKEVLDIITSKGEQNEDLILLYQGNTYSDGYARIGTITNDDEHLIFKEETD